MQNWMLPSSVSKRSRTCKNILNPFAALNEQLQDDTPGIVGQAQPKTVFGHINTTKDVLHPYSREIGMIPASPCEPQPCSLT
jgi:hypothetical protein